MTIKSINLQVSMSIVNYKVCIFLFKKTHTTHLKLLLLRSYISKSTVAGIFIISFYKKCFIL